MRREQAAAIFNGTMLSVIAWTWFVFAPIGGICWAAHTWLA